jgi:FAD synthetase
MKESFKRYLQDRPNVKAIFVGTRRTDPHGANLSHFDPTDHGWPPFMRVHPVIDWHYAEIWAVSYFTSHAYRCCGCSSVACTGIAGRFADSSWRRFQFIRQLKIPYCSLYDLGYTSLGGTTDTHPNPALKAECGTKAETFRPAYELVEDDAERLGRDW